jgi:phospholipase C
MPVTAAEHGGSKHHGHRAGVYSKISHIFVIVQENRSLNNLFAGDVSLAGANTTTTGYEETSTGGEKKINLVPEPLDTQTDIDHCYYDSATAINENAGQKQMDGFNYESLNGPCGPGPTAGPNPYAYVQPGAEIQTYWDLATNWILASKFYPTEQGPSFVAHLNLVAGTTEVKSGDAIADYPNGGWGCPNKTGDTVRNFGPSTPYATPGPYKYGPPCYDQFHTIADLLDCIYCTASQSPVQWRYYAPMITATGSQAGGIWSAFQAIKRVYHKGTGGDWSADVISPDYQVFNDITAGNLNNVGVTWVVPEVRWSDHAGQYLKDWGPSWVGDIVNTIGESPLWSSSVIVVLWDDWGGWYDPAQPPNLDFRGYGIRTPMLIISPYDSVTVGGASGHVFSSENLEPGSILKFIEQVYNLPTLGSLPCKENDYYYYYGCGLGYTDASSNSIGDVLNMNQNPLPYLSVPTVYGPSKFKNAYYYYSSVSPDNE